MSREETDLAPIYASMSTWPFYDTCGWLSPVVMHDVPPKPSDFDAVQTKTSDVAEEDPGVAFDIPPRP